MSAIILLLSLVITGEQNQKMIDQSFPKALDESYKLPWKFKENWVSDSKVLEKPKTWCFQAIALFSNGESGWNNVATFNSSQFQQALSWLVGQKLA